MICHNIYDDHLDRGKFTKQSKSVTAEHGQGEVHPFDHDNDHVDVDHDHGRSFRVRVSHGKCQMLGAPIIVKNVT